MLTTVQFYGHFFGRTIEIQNVRSDTILSEKLQPMKLAIADFTPKGSLGIGLFAAKLAAAIFQVWIVFQEAHNLITPPAPLLSQEGGRDGKFIFNLPKTTPEASLPLS